MVHYQATETVVEAIEAVAKLSLRTNVSNPAERVAAEAEHVTA
jgi:hypothetical protein